MLLPVIDVRAAPTTSGDRVGRQQTPEQAEPQKQTAHAQQQDHYDAFINNDPDLAAHILPSDNTVDQLYEILRVDLIEIMKEDSLLVEDGAALLVGLYDLERMADHATNIAENVIFLTQAKLVRHRGVNEEGIDLLGDLSE